MPVQFLCLGLPRTGTQTLADTFEAMGYGTIYHMREVHKRGHTLFWADAMRAHLGDAGFTAPGRVEFDGVLGEFSGVADLPAAPLVTELLDAYPEARVVLSVRDVDVWTRSMNSTLLHPKDRSEGDRLFPDRKELREAEWRLWDDDFDANGAAFFHSHNQKVRDQVRRRGRDLLELDVTLPGAFGQLCAWLGRPPPPGLTEFPKSDDWVAYKVAHGTVTT